MVESNGLTVLELFCGGGIGANGIKAAGYEIVKALDFDKNAVAAYRHNFGDHAEQADINSVAIGSLPDTDVIFGGPPCQDYSQAGKGEGAEGERGKLVFRYLDIIEEKRPKAFVFENVKGLIGKKHRHTFDALLTKFSEIGYEVSWQLVNAWHYGVAQKRERVFIVGVRQDLGISFEFPAPIDGDYQTKVLRDVIGDLPDPGVKLSEKQAACLERNPASVAKNRPVTFEEPSRTIPAVIGKGVPYGLFYPNHTGAVPTKEYGTRDGKVGRHPLSDMNEPAYTVIASTTGGKNGVRAPQPRRFTVRECLRIQSVPDSYVIPDDIPLTAQYRIVGNGIASRVAWYIGKALAEQLKEDAK